MQVLSRDYGFLYAVITAGLLFFLFFSAKYRNEFISIIKTLRITRQVYYTAVFIAGYFMAAGFIPEASTDYIKFSAGILLINLLFYSSLIINNVYDADIDCINKKSNPYSAGNIDNRGYMSLYYFLVIYTLLLSISFSLYVLLITIAIHLTASLYSAPPMRIKKVFILNTAAIAFATVLALLSGYTCASGQRALYGFNTGIAVNILILLTFAFNVKDVNDYEGDKACGIKTLMTVLGEKKGRIITGVLAFAAYVLFPFLFKVMDMFFYAAAGGIITALLVMMPKKRVNEPAVFGVMFLFIGWVIYRHVLM